MTELHKREIAQIDPQNLRQIAVMNEAHRKRFDQRTKEINTLMTNTIQIANLKGDIHKLAERNTLVMQRNDFLELELRKERSLNETKVQKYEACLREEKAKYDQQLEAQSEFQRQEAVRMQQLHREEIIHLEQRIANLEKENMIYESKNGY